MNTTYTTRQGDTWDKIAYQVYGGEQYAGWLMQNNFSQLDIFVFNAGVLLNTPPLPEKSRGTGLPVWRSR